ncbi:MAG TPA: hypothetical protein V6D05_13040 [Stenomitos sp.]
MVFTLAAATTLALASGTPAPSYETAPTPSVPQQQTIEWPQYVPVAASLFVPGSGQLIQGEWLKGLAHLGFGAACLAATQFGANQSDGTLRLVGGIGLVGIGLWSPWDAYQRVAPQHEGATP